jgi:myo-inositol-1(or 4)-monophosphatase
VTTLDNNTLVKTAIDAIMAGAKIADAAAAARAVVNNKGSLRDIVTQTDLDISAVLEQKLGATGHKVISEEGDMHAATGTYWVVDPIDGTVNFSHGLQQWAISAGLVEGSDFKLGVVCAPALDELYFTLNSERALLNGRPFSHVHRSPEDALIAASFAASAEAPVYAMFQHANQTTRGCLRTGSAALNICWAAAGKLQGAYGFKARLWDVAGALAVARAAGCAMAVRHVPGEMTLDYCVGSKEVVEHLLGHARELGLWD